MRSIVTHYLSCRFVRSRIIAFSNSSSSLKRTNASPEGNEFSFSIIKTPLEPWYTLDWRLTNWHIDSSSHLNGSPLNLARAPKDWIACSWTNLREISLNKLELVCKISMYLFKKQNKYDWISKIEHMIGETIAISWLKKDHNRLSDKLARLHSVNRLTNWRRFVLHVNFMEYSYNKIICILNNSSNLYRNSMWPF